VKGLGSLQTDPAAGDETLKNCGHVIWTLTGLRALKKEQR
jgi:hypothetical protein